jgi:hypothetical protein
MVGRMRVLESLFGTYIRADGQSAEGLGIKFTLPVSGP